MWEAERERDKLMGISQLLTWSIFLEKAIMLVFSRMNFYTCKTPEKRKIQFGALERD